MRVVAQCSGKEFALYQNTGLQHVDGLNRQTCLRVIAKNIGVVQHRSFDLAGTHVDPNEPDLM